MGMRVNGVVRWFSQYKGYGFLDVDNINGDVFVHFSLIDAMGIKDLQPRDELECEVELKGKGYQVTKIFNIKKAAPVDGTDDIRQVPCVVKWFNPAKGYGFAENEQAGDIFIHSSLLKPLNLKGLNSGTKLKAKVMKQHRGYEAISIELA